MAEIEFRDLAPGDAGWIVRRHAELYAADEGFDAGFETLVAEIVAAYLRDRDPARERGWIAHRGGRRLGSILCVRGPAPDVAQLRLFLVEPDARGQGLGARLLAACLGWARARGYARMALWTHESHRAACALYARDGFTLRSSRPVRRFGRDLVEQHWDKLL